ncbi:helix-turn-helix domain-containing protein [Streptomyces hygroscopicus subsp. hygroscopicus]|uniref:Transcriptional regulator with XRE-family HTH domain n=2 Tax=Streptomyces TaxID=1883 RepID=A0ABT9L4B3_9ACTN|nr:MULTISPECIES: helix-turn-helix transcriptional regulator [Streptomyces]MBW8092058.1 helix-turn-helix domain-containing protein [Streptomyces hygroscopicus subsp. hygroscopicus]MCO8308706.1 helix-turn-helix domain-containing protein [Streptomyces sp. RKCA744]MDN3060215.1 helix-turn-helix transcriptional regulator [Streptomyces sp. SRF1]MDP9615518.1 transcriptional regulator with XRE-family HTH domain [Streptomyces demainii]GHJ33419.1 transcriptional regulator [Streptomyces hygroscopicus]
MSEPRSAPTVGQVVLGKRLQDLREKAGFKRDEAARVLRVAPATVRRMETAEVSLKVPYVQMLLDAYGITGEELDSFITLTEEANKPGWWQRFHDILPDWFSVHVSLEGAAEMIRAYEPHFVPGLLQTEDYARAVMQTGAVGQSGPQQAERHVALRMERQTLLTRRDPPRLWVVMDETVLRRQVGSPAVMRRQIDRLLESTEMPHITLQVSEFSSGHHPGTYGPFVLFRFAVPELPDMVYVEYLTGAVYLDERIEVASHLEAMDRMAAQAATARRTKEILRDFRKEL